MRATGGEAFLSSQRVELTTGVWQDLRQLPRNRRADVSFQSLVRIQADVRWSDGLCLVVVVSGKLTSDVEPQLSESAAQCLTRNPQPASSLLLISAHLVQDAHQ
ncbi:MAG: hypothetical protein JWN70_6316 [Planctomycetaceae bacterium]|nr:hypothetical protein [Planctomycetaceae bacterium]